MVVIAYLVLRWAGRGNLGYPGDDLLLDLLIHVGEIFNCNVKQQIRYQQHPRTQDLHHLEALKRYRAYTEPG